MNALSQGPRGPTCGRGHFAGPAATMTWNPHARTGCENGGHVEATDPVEHVQQTRCMTHDLASGTLIS